MDSELYARLRVLIDTELDKVVSNPVHNLIESGFWEMADGFLNHESSVLICAELCFVSFDESEVETELLSDLKASD